MIDQIKIRDALADFHGLIAEGWEAKAAIAEAASSNGIPAENLEARLAHYSDISSLVEESRIRADLQKVAAEINGAVKDLRFRKQLKNIFEDPFDFDAARAEIERRMGRHLSEDEVDRLATARRDYRQEQFRKMFEIGF